MNKVMRPASELPPDPAAQAPTPGVSVLNIANALTVLRLVLVPFFAIALLAHDGHDTTTRIWAWAIFAVASITDRLDGELARKHNLVTSFGKLADPIADKALTGTALVALSTLGDLPWWVTIVVLCREIGVTLLRFWVIQHGVIPASRGGKAKTLAQGIAIGLYVLPLTGVWASGRVAVMAVAVALTIITGVDYIGRAVRLRRISNAQAR